MTDTERITEAIEEGIDNYDGDGTIEMLVAMTLIEHGWTVPGCDNDEYALAEYVYDAMPTPGPATDHLPRRALAEHIYNHIDGGFVTLDTNHK